MKTVSLNSTLRRLEIGKFQPQMIIAMEQIVKTIQMKMNGYCLALIIWIQHTSKPLMPQIKAMVVDGMEDCIFRIITLVSG